MYWNKKPQTYIPLSNLCAPSQISSPKPKTHSTILTSTAFITTLLLLIASLLLNHPTPSPIYLPDTIPDEEWNHCCRTSETAISKGCIMEPLFYGWMPSQCTYPELSAQYPVFEDRIWYMDRELSTPITNTEELWEGKYDPIYTGRYHAEHCLFQRRKLQFAIRDRMEGIDNKTMSLEHSGHCADELSAPGWSEGEGDASEVELGFYRCRRTLW